MSLKNEITKKYKNIIDREKFNDIVDSYSKFMMDKVCEGHLIFLPCRFGTLQIVGRKQQVRIVDNKIKGLAPDWVRTKKLWDENPKAKEEKKLLYHENPNEDGYRFRFAWSKRNVFITNKNFYSLRVSRKNKRVVSNLIKEGYAERFKNN